MPDVAWLNSLPTDEAVTELLRCCGSKRWAAQVANKRPFQTLTDLITHAHDVWRSLDPGDWLEAFRSHPKIGEKKAGDKWSAQEQAGVKSASTETTTALAALNYAYEQKFGYIFIICATGKSSDEMLSSLRERIEHDAAEELPIAAAEQSKITELRLKKLLTSP